MTSRYIVSVAGLLMLGGACATGSKQANESPNPATREVAASQKASEEALKQAEQSQKQATEQTQKAADAQAHVTKDQQQLQQDQEKLRQEQAKAQQMQSQAKQESQQAARQTEQKQAAAAATLSQQTQEFAQGRQTAAGVVTNVRPDEVTVQPASGQAMHFRVNDSTRVEGMASSADRIKEGQQARVSYEPSADGPTAVSIRVSSAGSSQGMGSSSGTGSGSSTGTNTDSSSGMGSGSTGASSYPSDTSASPQKTQ